MDLIESLDRSLFCFINQTMSNAVFDVLMPFLSRNVLFIPFVVLAVTWMIWKYRARGLVCVLMLGVIVGPGDKFITNKIKQAIGRPRPYLVIPETRLPASKSKEAIEPPLPPVVIPGMQPSTGKRVPVGMPSSHAANWGSAGMILFLYFRRSLWITFPLGVAVSYSRIYNGVHYPSDVLVGYLLGATYAALLVWIFDAAWRHLGAKYFPRRLEQLPTLIISSPPGPPVQPGPA